MIFRKEKRIRNRSQQILQKAVESGHPFSYFYEHVDEYNELIFDDFMWLLRSQPAITFTSHDVVDSYERHMFRESDLIYLNIFKDINRLLRDKVARDELPQ